MAAVVRRLALCALIGGLLAGLVAAPGAGATAAAAPAMPVAADLPAHVYAPYFEAWDTSTLTAMATDSGASYFTVAFLQTTGKTSCTLAWNGSKSTTVAGGKYLADLAQLRQMGGDIIPSLGGWSADQGGTEIGDSCSSAAAIAAAYEQLVTVYGVKRIDMDIEGRSLAKPANITRRNQAIALLQAWARTNQPSLTIQYTLPVTPTGLAPSGLAVLLDAKKQGVTIDLVNPMAFDYGGGVANMGDAAIGALKGVHDQLMSQLGMGDLDAWAHLGVTIMNGVDDTARRAEITTVADAIAIRDFAVSKGMPAYSMWAIQRDNGTCAGTGGNSRCSGVAQATWEFTTNLKGFTGQ